MDFPDSTQTDRKNEAIQLAYNFCGKIYDYSSVLSDAIKDCKDQIQKIQDRKKYDMCVGELAYFVRALSCLDMMLADFKRFDNLLSGLNRNLVDWAQLVDPSHIIEFYI